MACVNFYDVHGGGKINSGKFQLVNNASEVTVDSNRDNSIDTNAFNVNQGQNCTGPVVPSIKITKTANPAGPVNAGDTIGFDITVSNTGTGSALSVVVSDSLPAGGGGLDWSLNPAFAGCSISGAQGSQSLSCSFSSIGQGQSVGPIHVQSGTTNADCGIVTNTASVTTDNAGADSSTASVTVNCAAIHITKTANPAGPVNAGDTIGFDITVNNSGNAAATNVVVSDSLPAGGGGLDWSLNPAFSGCSISGAIGSQVLSCTFASIGAGQSVGPIHVQSSTTSADCGAVENTAPVQTDNAGSDSSTASVTVNCASISIFKTANPAGPVNAGDDIGFDVTVSNGGPGTAYGVAVSDSLPAGADLNWSLDPFSGCQITGSVGNQTLSCSFASLGSGQSEGPIHVTSPTTKDDVGTVTNTATVTTTNDGSDQSTASVDVQAANISIIKTANPAGPVTAGDPIGFDVTVSNAGPGTAYGVVVSDALPAGTDLNWSLSPAFPGCAVNGGVGFQTLDCTFTSLASGGSEGPIHVTSATTKDDVGTVTNTATVTTTNDGSDTSTASVVVQAAGVTILKVADQPEVTAGENIGFTITVTSTGPGTAEGVQVSDPMPTDAGTSWSIDGGTGQADCSIVAGIMSCDFGDMAPGSSLTVHITSPTTYATVADSPVVNTATVTSSNAGSEQSTDQVIVDCPRVKLLVTPDASRVHVGSNAGFTIKAVRKLNGVAHGIVLTDTLPNGLSWVLDGGNGQPLCSLSGNTLTCTFGDMWQGASYTMHVSAKTVQPGTLVDVAEVEGTSPLTYWETKAKITVV